MKRSFNFPFLRRRLKGVRRYLASVSALVFLLTSVHGQSLQVARDPRALQLLTLCSTAMSASDPAATVLATGKVTSAHPDDPQVQLAIKSKGEGSQRWELNSSTAQETIVLHDGHGRNIRNSLEVPLSKWQVKYVRQEHFPGLLCASATSRTNMEIAYVGLETVAGASVHHLRMSVAPNGKSKFVDSMERLISEFNIFVDAQSSIVQKTSRYVFSPEAVDNRSLLETYYSNYKSVDGVLMPFTITQFLASKKLQVINFDAIKINAGVSDADFAD